MAKKRKKQPWEIVIKDRFITNTKPDNPYVTVFLYFIVFLLSFLLIFVCFFQLCEIKGSSMYDSLENGDHVLLLKVSSTYKRGDIVVITKDKEDGTKMNIIKRVIAVGGDTLRFDVNEGVFSEDGTSETVSLYMKKKGKEEFDLCEEKYILEPMKKSAFPQNFAFGKEIVVDPDFVYVMGDNRNHSEDSRKDGAYSVNLVYNKSVLTIQKDSLLEKLLKILYHENNTADDSVTSSI